MDFVRNFLVAAALAGAAAVCLASCTGGGTVIVIGDSSSQSSSSQSSSSSPSSVDPPDPDPDALKWEYSLNADGTITITGCTVSGLSVYGEIAVPSEYDGHKVQSIGDKAFYGQSNLTKITLPNTVEKIGDEAFENCTGLKEIKLFAGLKEIGRQAFGGCSSLERLELPSTVRRVGTLAFDRCTALQKAIVRDNAYGESLTIEAFAFNGCTALKKIYLPRNLVKLNNLFTAGVELEDLYYGGGEEEWSKLAAEGNAPQAAEIHYLASPKDLDDDSEEDASTSNSSPSNSSSSESSSYSSTADYPAQLLALINAERAKQGLSPLTMTNAALTSAAQKRAEEQEKRPGHVRPNGENYATVLEEAGLTGYTAKAEICDKTGYTVPSNVVNRWMNSTARSYIQKDEFTEMGVGYYESAQTGQCYWVVLFVGYNPL